MAMAALNSKKILEEINGRDANSVLSLTLTHRALSDVISSMSCLVGFKNLERLDLCSNELTSVEGLIACVNLKWLSVAQNQIESLEGIQGLTKLTVLNAGKNKLKSMAGVGSLVSLRALILNDNEIISIGKLDQIKELNTLVLSRNPVTEIGDSLAKAKSIKKLSLSNCRLQAVGSSLTSCTELKELRLAHNEIKVLPAELNRNAKLQNLDLGNNWVRNMSDLKALSHLFKLRNLNLQGNPIAEKDSLVKKIKKLLPNLKIFNGRPTDNFMGKYNDRADRSLTVVDVQMDRNKELGTPVLEKNSKTKALSDGEDADPLNTAGHGTREKSDLYTMKELPTNAKENHKAEKKRKKKLKPHSEVDGIVDSKTTSLDSEVEEDSKLKRQKTDEPLATNTDSAQEQKESLISREKDRKPKKKLKQNAAYVINDAEVPFADLFPTQSSENNTNSEQEMARNRAQSVDSAGGSVTIPAKNKKIRASITDLSQVVEVGLGGPSTWDE